MAGPGNILIKIGADAGQAVRELGTVNKSLGSTMTTSEKMSAGLRKAAVPAAAALGAIAIGAKKAIGAASDLNEQVNKAGAVFGPSSKEIVAWSKTLTKSFGISQRAALEAAGTFGNMLVPMGLSRKEAAKMSKSMVQLAGDMASFNNASPEETLDALRSGLAGETEPLRKFGVFLSQSRIEAQALSSGLVKANVEMDEVHKRQANIAKSRLAVAEATKKYGKASIETQSATAKLEYEEKKLHAALAGKVPALTAAQKAQATYQLITKDTADAQGDFARTSDSAANASRVQAAEMENLTAELGQSLLPTYQALQQMLLKIIGFTAKHTTAVKILVGSVAALSAAILIANAAMKAWTAAQAIAKAATVAYTLAVRALNFALAANPIGLVVAALAALAAGLYLAYTRSETFRRIVNAAMGSVAGAVQAVGRAFNALREAAAWAFHWIIDHWKVALFAFGPIGAALYLIVTRFDQIRSAASSAFNAITAAIDRVIAAVRELIGWLGKIHVPKIKLPKIPGTHTVGYYAVPPAGRSAAGAYAAVGAGGLTVNVYGAVDPEGTARAIRRILERHDRRQGRIA